jgi:hypothetical protein
MELAFIGFLLLIVLFVYLNTQSVIAELDKEEDDKK